MLEPQTQSEESAPGSAGASARLLPLHIATGTAVVAGAIDAGVAMMGDDPTHLPHAALGAALPLALVLFSVLWFTLGTALRRVARVERVPLAFGIAAGVELLFVGAALKSFVDIDTLAFGPGSVTEAFQLGIGLLLATALGASTTLAVAGLHPGRRSTRLLRRLALVAPATAAAQLALVWVYEQRNQSGHFEPALPVLFAIGLGLVLFGAIRVRSEAPLRASIYLAAIFTLLAPAAVARVLSPGSFAGAPTAGGTPAVAGAARGLLLITVDALRQDGLSLYSNEAVPTPAFDALGRDGLVYDAAYSGAPWTLPSLATLMSGVDATVHGVDAAFPELPDALPTLADRMRAAGYRTAAIGSNPWLRVSALDRGFDQAHFYPVYRYASAGSRLVDRWVGLGVDPALDLDTRQLTDEAIGWLHDAGPEPFFLWLHYYDPHDPFAPPREMLDGERAPSPTMQEGWDRPSLVLIGKEKPTLAEKEWIRRLYTAEIQYVDRELGRLLAALRELGLYDDLTIALTADHGEEFWDHGRAFHGHSLYDELVRVPLILKLPGSARPGRIEAPVALRDLGATLLALSGVAQAGDRDLAAIPVTPGHASRGPVTCSGTQHFERREALVADGYKYVAYLDAPDRELYDLTRDPRERRNRVEAEPARAARFERLWLEQRQAALAQRQELGLESGGRAPLTDSMRARLRALGYAQ